MSVLSHLFFLCFELFAAKAILASHLEDRAQAGLLSPIAPGRGRFTVNMDKNSFAAIAACIVFFVGYQVYMSQKYPNMGVPDQADQKDLPAQVQPGEGEAKTSSSQESLAEVAEPTPLESPELPPSKQLKPDELILQNAETRFEFQPATPGIQRIQLKKYFDKSAKGERFVEVLDGPLQLSALTDPKQEVLPQAFRVERLGDTIHYSRQDGPFEIKQSFQLSDTGYGVKALTTYTNVSDKPQPLTAALAAETAIEEPEESTGFGPMNFNRKTFAVGIDGGQSFEDAMSFCKDEDQVLSEFNLTREKVDFVGFDMHYFLGVLQPKMERVSTRLQKKAARGKDCQIQLVVYEAMGQVAPGERIQFDFSSYFGPKDLDLLESQDPVLAHTINFTSIGINLSVIALPLLNSIKFFYSHVGNYGIAIILVTLVLKILFYPLTKSAAMSMRRMQALQPEMTKIREKYKNDPQKQQQSLMKFMSANKANPMKGCLPILPQMPVFLAFYTVLSQAIELRQAPLMGWISDLSLADPYYISPLLLGGLMFMQQRLTPTPGMDPNQQKIMMMMPLVFTVMMLGLPAGLVLYMIVNTVISIGQQQWLNRKLKNKNFEVVRVSV